jgi:hypothetical protein
VIHAIAADPLPVVFAALVIYLIGLKHGRKQQRREWGMPRW